MTASDAARSKWERELRDALATYPEYDATALPPQYVLEDVVLEDSYPDTTLSLVFRDTTRPQCLFGYRYGTFWDEVEHRAGSRRQGWIEEQPAAYASLVWVSFGEALLDVPVTCEPTRITWIVEALDSLEAAARRV